MPLYGCAATDNLFIAVGLGGTILRSQDTVVASVDHGMESQTPKVFKLRQNYPSPFNPSTRIDYELPSAGYVTLKVFTILGREIKTLVNEFETPGSYSIEWDGAGMPSGIYFYRLSTDSFVDQKKMVLIK